MYHVHVNDAVRLSSGAPGQQGADAGSSGSIEPASMPEEISFAAGNPSIELLRGSVRMFRENGIPVQSAQGRSRTLLVIAVPNTITASDWCSFIGPASTAIEHQRIVRPVTGGGAHTGGPYCVLMRFNSQESADSFYRGFNGKPFTSFGSERCHVVYVAQVKLQPRASAAAAHSASQASGSDSNASKTAGTAPETPLLPSDPLIAPATSETPAAVVEQCASSDANATDSFGSGRASTGLTELPTCPVCLERLDSSATGLITTTCNHSFHGTCLSRWANHHCPVCRYTLGGDDDDDEDDDEAGGVGGRGDGGSATTCQVCGVRDNVWLCLICGFAGCGRFSSSHALHHWRDSGHAYAIELRTQRVWSYSADEYVHRLIASQAGGKVVELPDPRGAGAGAGGSGSGADCGTGCGYIANDCSDELLLEKTEGLSFEYTMLLTSQLDAQRCYYEDLLSRLLSCVPEGDPDRRAAAEEIVHMHTMAGQLHSGHDSGSGSGSGAGHDRPAHETGVALSAAAAAYLDTPESPIDLDGSLSFGTTGRAAMSSSTGAGTGLSTSAGAGASNNSSSSAAAGAAAAARAAISRRKSSLSSAPSCAGACTYASELAKMQSQFDQLSARCAQLEAEVHEAASRVSAAESTKRALARQVEAANERAALASEELAFLRDVNDNLISNQAGWEKKLKAAQAQAETLEKRFKATVADLEEQVRDLMFALETQQKLSSMSEERRAEIAGGTIVTTGNGGGRGGSSGGASTSVNGSSKAKAAFNGSPSTSAATGAAAGVAGDDDGDGLPSLFGKGPGNGAGKKGRGGKR